MAAASHHSLVFHFLEPLMSAGVLDRLQRILLARYPRWASAFGSRAARAPSAHRVNLAVAGSLRGAVADEAAAGSPVQESLRRTIGGRRLPGRSVQIGFRGLGDRLHLNISASTRLFLGRAFDGPLANDIQLVFRAAPGPKLDAELQEVFRECCEQLRPLYGRGHSAEEWDAKNMTMSFEAWSALPPADRTELAALGADLTRGLPGIYWLNFFGPPYATVIGERVLAASPVLRAERVGAGHLWIAYPSSADWSSDRGRLTIAEVLAHTGNRHFFSRDDRKRKLVTPDWTPWRTSDAATHADWFVRHPS